MFYLVRSARRLWVDEGASQMVEFAVSLPLMIVMVVGIFDFSGAYTLKHKLANAARDGARAAAADPATDLGNGGVPVSVSDAFQVVDNDLKNAENINDCGIAAPVSSGPLTWSSTANAPPACSITFTINRGYIISSGSTVTSPDCTSPTLAVGTKIVATCVMITYKYQWRFSSVASVLLPPTLTEKAVALNEN
jgi:Flp pilus assembly protein TadG